MTKPRGEMRPMLACPAPTEGITFPCLGSPKVDGVRCVVKAGRAMTRRLELVPNAYVQQMLGMAALEGLDGELCVGAPYADNVFNDTMRGVMRQDGMPQFTLHVFDFWNGPEGLGYAARHKLLREYMSLPPYSTHPHLAVLETRELANMEELVEYQEDLLERGYEGLMIRSMDGPYKFGRSTAKQGWLMKVKRFSDGEARVVGVTEMMRNENELETNAVGGAKRSTAKDGLVPAGVLGALAVEDLKTGVKFSIGSGFDAEERQSLWNQREGLPGLIVTYRHFEVGVKDAPRFPTFKGFRHPSDIGDPRL